MAQGVVKWFDPKKGYRFITTTCCPKPPQTLSC